MGCTIRYEYGLFRQKIVDGYQVEVPDNWLESGNVWEIARPGPDRAKSTSAAGWRSTPKTAGSSIRHAWTTTTVEAVPYDMPVVGYDIRHGEHAARVVGPVAQADRHGTRSTPASTSRAMEERELAEVISKVLYPNDNNYEGKELRLKQQYFFSSASDAVCRAGFYQGLRLQLGHLPG